MKDLIFINGTMGSGKSTVSRALLKILPRTAFLDGDWCWTMQPSIVTDETRAMVLDNVRHVLRNFLLCSEFQHVLFCWVMHQQGIMHSILKQLPLQNVRVHLFTLDISPEVLVQRLNKDILAGKRSPSCVEQSFERLPLYKAMSTIHIDVNSITPEETARIIVTNMADPRLKSWNKGRA